MHLGKRTRLVFALLKLGELWIWEMGNWDSKSCEEWRLFLASSSRIKTFNLCTHLFPQPELLAQHGQENVKSLGR